MLDKTKNPLLLALINQVVPEVMESGADRMVVARATWEAMRKEKNLPLGMRVTRRPLRSRRVAVHGQHLYGKRSLVNASWPKDGLHSLRTQKLCVVLKGNITFQCGDAVLHCQPGHIIFIPPDVPHPNGSQNHLEETSTPRGNCDLLFLGAYADGVVAWLSHTRHGVHRGEGTYSIFQRHTQLYFDLLLEEIASSEQYACQRCGALLTLLVTSVCNALRENSSVQAMVPEERNEARQSMVARAQDYVVNHISKKLTINEVARHVYLSRTQFTSQFRRETGKSFNEYLSDCRFEKAKVLLLDPTEWSISRISNWVGLKPGMLRKLFLQRLQMSPTQFREQHRNRPATPRKNKG
jgi:AraC-like DNA-binding protein